MRSTSPNVVLVFAFFLATSGAGAGEPRVEHNSGFRTMVPGADFPRYWASLKDRHKMHGKVSEHVTRESIDAVIMLEVNIAIALDPRFPTLQDELWRFMTEGNRFLTGPLPDGFAKSPRKHLVAVFRTKMGDYGLITLYREFAVIELKGLVGVAPASVDVGESPPTPAAGNTKPWPVPAGGPPSTKVSRFGPARIEYADEGRREVSFLVVFSIADKAVPADVYALSLRGEGPGRSRGDGGGGRRASHRRGCLGELAGRSVTGAIT